MSVVGGGGLNWYVDSVAGNDANDGKSATAAFATIAAVQAVALAGQTINLKRGSTWREQLTIGVGVDNVTVKAYGTGADPDLDCSDIAANASWSKTGGRTNVYQIGVTTNYVANEPGFVSVWEDGVRLPIVASVAACDAAAGSYYVLNNDSTTPTVYVHSTDSSAMTTNGKVYEINTRNAGVYSYFASGVSITGVTARRGLCNGGSFKIGPGSTLTDCKSYDGNKHNIYVRAGCHLTNCLMQDAYFYESATMFVLNDDTPNGEETTVTNCTFEMSSRAVAWWGNIAGVFGHKNVSGSFGNITFTGCTFINLFQAVTDIADTPVQSFVNCTFTNCARGWASLTAAAHTVNLTDCTWSSVVANQRFLDIEQALITVNIDGCQIDFNGSTDVGTIYVVAAATVEVKNCTFKNNGFFVAIALYNSSADAVLNFHHNTFDYVHGGSAWGFTYNYWVAGGAPAGFISDYNSFAAGEEWQGITAYHNLADWRTASGQDAHSTGT
jgi:hypothetical protein